MRTVRINHHAEPGYQHSYELEFSRLDSDIYYESDPVNNPGVFTPVYPVPGRPEWIRIIDARTIEYKYSYTDINRFTIPAFSRDLLPHPAAHN